MPTQSGTLIASRSPMEDGAGRLERRAIVRPSSYLFRRRSLIWLAVLLAGCAASSKRNFEGPSAPAAFSVEPWAFKKDKGARLRSEHYDIYTTINTPDVRRSIVQVMEAALVQYHKVAPGVLASDRPMDCFVMGNREQWMDLTRQRTGRDARGYFQINRGAFTVQDWYLAYYIGEAATYSVAAHEGWHQFVSRHFKGRMAPFLEEGISTMFEDIEWKDDLPRWDLTRNRSRAQSLKRVVEGRFTFPLGEVLNMHAGDVIDQSGNRIEAFYAQAWAFATFLYYGQDGKYRKGFQRLLAETADGTLVDPSRVYRSATAPWRKVDVKPILEHYLGTGFQTIDADFQAYVRKVAFDEYERQWN